MRPLEKLPTIRAKLGSTIVFAVAMTLALVFLLLGYALRDTSRDSERLELLSVARRAADGAHQIVPGGITVVVLTPDGGVVSGTPPEDLPRFTDGMVHVGVRGDVQYAVVPVVVEGRLHDVPDDPGQAPAEAPRGRWEHALPQLVEAPHLQE